MIHYLKIKNFGPVKNDAEINFEVAENMEQDEYEVEMADGKRLLKLAYIYGANASGKTTILDAFEFLRKLLLVPLENKASELDYDPFLFCENAFESTSDFELSFYVEKLRYIYTVEFSKQSVLNEKLVYYQTLKPTVLFSRITDSKKRLAKIHFGNRIKVPAREKDLIELNTLHNNSVFGAYARTNVDIPELEALNRWFTAYLLGVVTSATDLTQYTAKLISGNPEINDWINKFLNKADQQITAVDVLYESDDMEKAIDSSDVMPGVNGLNESYLNMYEKVVIKEAFANITPLSFLKRRQKIDVIHDVVNGKRYVLSIQKESSGTQRYFGLGGILYELIHHSHLLCIDELETSLHPDLMKHFLQMFVLNVKSSQLLVTTHNLSLMAEQDFLRRDALWFSEKGEDGSISLYSAADFDTSVLRKDANLINAYKSGKLGAKPNLGSPYIKD